MNKFKSFLYWATVLLVPGGSLLLISKMRKMNFKVSTIVEELEKAARRIENEDWDSVDVRVKKSIVRGIRLAARHVQIKFLGEEDVDSSRNPDDEQLPIEGSEERSIPDSL